MSNCYKLIMACLLVVGPTALAQTTLTVDNGCMEEAAGFGLNCTANDVQLAGVATDANGDPLLEILDDGCAFPGDEVTFRATFEVVLTAQERHDIGVYFATDGDPDGDGAITGDCTISTIPYESEFGFLDLDGFNDGGYCANAPDIICENDRDCRSVGGDCVFVQDTCGDIDSGHSPLYPTITITTECIDPDGNRILNLPNCTSWRQPGANELCTGPLGTFPGSPSKCRCDLGFEVPIDVPPAELLVEKSANPAVVNEPGGDVTFTVAVTNLSPFSAVTLTEISDDEDNDGTDDVAYDASVVCATTLLQPGQTTECTFTRAVIGNAGAQLTDVATATGVDSESNTVSGSDDATVTIADVPAVPLSVVKSVTSASSLPEPGGDFDFQVVVTNGSTVDTATVTDLDDTFLDNLQTSGSCIDADGDNAAPYELSPAESMTCTFTVSHAGQPATFDNQVAVAATDDDGADVGAVSNVVTVGITDVPAVPLTIVKSVTSASSLPEPGGDFDFQVVVTNGSTVDTAAVTDLDDTFLDNLQTNGSCVDQGGDTAAPWELSPGESLTCTFTVPHIGDTGTFDDQVSVAATDDDGANIGGVSNTVTVAITDVPPAASLLKTAISAAVTYRVVVKNDSTAEALTVDALSDDRFQNVADAANPLLVSTTCSVPQVLQPAGSDGDTYTCSFVALIDAANSPHTNTLTGTVSDNDVPTSVTPSDSATVELK